jgi:hypothetical protein
MASFGERRLIDRRALGSRTKNRRKVESTPDDGPSACAPGGGLGRSAQVAETNSAQWACRDQIGVSWANELRCDFLVPKRGSSKAPVEEPICLLGGAGLLVKPIRQRLAMRSRHFSEPGRSNLSRPREFRCARPQSLRTAAPPLRRGGHSSASGSARARESNRGGRVLIAGDVVAQIRSPAG